jgi:hypothetical protein
MYLLIYYARSSLLIAVLLPARSKYVVLQSAETRRQEQIYTRGGRSPSRAAADTAAEASCRSRRSGHGGGGQLQVALTD